MVGGLTRRILPYLSGVPHLHVNRPLDYFSWYISDSLSCRHEQPCGQHPWYENCLHCSGRPGEWPGAPPLSYLRVSMNAVPPPPSIWRSLSATAPAPESGTETYPICGDPLSRSTRRSSAPLQNLRRNHCVKRSLMKPHPICFSCLCKSYPVLCIDVVVQFYPWFNWLW